VISEKKIHIKNTSHLDAGTSGAASCVLHSSAFRSGSPLQISSALVLSLIAEALGSRSLFEFFPGFVAAITAVQSEYESGPIFRMLSAKLSRQSIAEYFPRFSGINVAERFLHLEMWKITML
jgi:hypothetical protein